MDLNEIAVFLKVVEQGSFTKAAKALDMPNSTVSSKVSDLERRLGVTLIKRTTRKLFVTDEGKAFFDKCTKGLEAIRTAEEEITEGQKEPSGLLRLTAPIELGIAVLPNVVMEFRKLYPKVHLDISLSDRTVDLISEGYDLAIRAADLKDSSFKARKLGSVYFAPFASAQYLKKAGTPKSPKELIDHCCIQFAPIGTDEWKLIGPKGLVSIPMKKQIVVNELDVIKSLTLGGMGIAMLPTFHCYPEVQSGKLVRILPEYKTQVRNVHFVYSSQKQGSPKINAFISVAMDIIKKSLESYEL